MEKGTIILICGLPGAGKSTLAKQLETERSAVRFCPDEWMQEMGISLWDGKIRDILEQRFWQLAQQFALNGGTAVLENGFWSRSERDGYLKGARDIDIKIELHYLDVSIDELRRRLGNRGMEGDELIAREKLEQYFADFDRPDTEELLQYDSAV